MTSTIPKTHTKARSAHPSYPSRFSVADEFVSWKTNFPAYEPVNFTHPAVIANDCTKKPNGWADPEQPDREDLLKRISFCGNIELDEFSKPRNPVGRTGMMGRGLLGKWGPNHAADPIVTRLNPDNKKLEMVAIQRKDTKEWAIPGGMVDAGERVSATLKREFAEEAMGNLSEEDQEKFGIKKQLDVLFTNGNEIYKGYVDDPRNTDQAWMETVAVHFHCPSTLGDHLTLEAGDDAQNVRWILVEDNPDLRLYASHEDFVKKAVENFYSQKEKEKERSRVPVVVHSKQNSSSNMQPWAQNNQTTTTTTTQTTTMQTTTQRENEPLLSNKSSTWRYFQYNQIGAKKYLFAILIFVVLVFLFFWFLLR